MAYVVEDKRDNLFYAGKSDGWVEDLQEARVYETEKGARDRANKIPVERQKEAIKEAAGIGRLIPGKAADLLRNDPEVREAVRGDDSIHEQFEAVEVETKIEKVDGASENNDLTTSLDLPNHLWLNE